MYHVYLHPFHSLNGDFLWTEVTKPNVQLILFLPNFQCFIQIKKPYLPLNYEDILHYLLGGVLFTIHIYIYNPLRNGFCVGMR